MSLVDLTTPTYTEGAGYGMSANLYGGGFKHFDIEGFIETVEAQDWKERANVQLWIKGEEVSRSPSSSFEVGRDVPSQSRKPVQSRMALT